MDLVNAVWTFLTDSVLPFLPYIWPFLFVTVVLAVAGQVFKRKVWTKDNAKRNLFFAIMRDSYVLHPLGLGWVTGTLWQDPCGDDWPYMAAIAYFTLAGVTSLVGYWWLDKWLEKRGYDLDEVFETPHSIPPPASLPPIHSEVTAKVPREALTEDPPSDVA